MDRLKHNKKVTCILNNGVTIAISKLKSELKDSSRTTADDLKSLDKFRVEILALLDNVRGTLNGTLTSTGGKITNGTSTDVENNNSDMSPLVVKRRPTRFDLCLGTTEEETNGASSYENDDWRDTLRRSIVEPLKPIKEERTRAFPILDTQESDEDDIFIETSAKCNEAPESPVDSKDSLNGPQEDDDDASNHSADTVIYDVNEHAFVETNNDGSDSKSSFVFNSTAELLDVLASDDECAKDAGDARLSATNDESTEDITSDSPKVSSRVVDSDGDQAKSSPSGSKTLIVKLFNSEKDLLQHKDISDTKTDSDMTADSPLSSNSQHSNGSFDPKEEIDTKSVHLDDSPKEEFESEEIEPSQCSTLSVVLVDCIKYGSQQSKQVSSLGSEGTEDVSFLKSMDELLKVCRVEYLQPDYEMQPNLQQLDVAEKLLKCFNDAENQRAEEERLKEDLRNWTSSSSDTQSSDDDEINESRVSLKNVIGELKRRKSDSSTDSEDIDRLCDLSTLGRRKVHTKSLNRMNRKRKKLDSDTDTDSKKSSSGSSSRSDESDSDIEVIPSRPSTPKLDAVTEAKINEIIMRNVCDQINETERTETASEDEEEEKKGERKNRVASEVPMVKVGDEGGCVKKLTPEELAKKSWRNDPLLTRKLSTDSSDGSIIIGPKIKRNKRRISSSESSSAGGTIPTINRELSSIAVSSDSSSCDSDCEIIARDETDVNNEEFDKQRGRRNIRALVSDECLAEATQRANKEEQERIERLEERQKKLSSLSQSFSQESEHMEVTPSPDEVVDPLILDLDEFNNPLVEVHRKLVKGLKPHQIEGVRFMWDSCYESIDMIKKSEGSGCILAHCMGLGKTIQVITLIHALFAHKETNARRVLVVCPLSTVPNWVKEIDRAFEPIPKEKFNTFAIPNTRVDYREIIKNWSISKKSVLIVGYDLFRTVTSEKNLDKLGAIRQLRVTEALIDPGPDLIVCDEGHLLMNKNCRRTVALSKVKTKRRIVLTGTPLQNNLKEYYFMVQFVKPNLLGTFKEYNTNFVNPITNGQYKDSTLGDISLMKKRTHVLHNLLKKTIHRVEDVELKMYLPRIVDYAVFIKMTNFQTEMHKKFMELITSRCDYKNIISNYKTFQYIGAHPSVLVMNHSLQKKKTKEEDVIMDDHDYVDGSIDGWWKTMMPDDVKDSIDYGNKMLVLMGIIEESEKIGDKVLVFSQSLAEMDLIEHFLSTIGTSGCPSWKKEVDYLRMDGTVMPELRTKICDKFNDKLETKIRLLLMSIKVGGLGLNLTAANRVVIMTVSWNPSYDVQSVFRVYRFGQEKEVFVYRLVSVGTMEEKVYQRTVTKLAVAHRVVDKHQIQRHYKTLDLEDMYSCKPESIGERPVCRLPEDTILGKLILKLKCVYRYHDHQTLLVNRPEENLNPSELAAAWEEFKNNQFAPPPPPPQPQPHVGLPPYEAIFFPSAPQNGPSTSGTSGSSGALDLRAGKYKRKKYSYDAVTRAHRQLTRPSTNYYNQNSNRQYVDTAANIAAIRRRLAQFSTTAIAQEPTNEL